MSVIMGSQKAADVELPFLRLSLILYAIRYPGKYVQSNILVFVRKILDKVSKSSAYTSCNQRMLSDSI